MNYYCKSCFKPILKTDQIVIYSPCCCIFHEHCLKDTPENLALNDKDNLCLCNKKYHSFSCGSFTNPNPGKHIKSYKQVHINNYTFFKYYFE